MHADGGAASGAWPRDAPVWHGASWLERRASTQGRAPRRGHGAAARPFRESALRPAVQVNLSAPATVNVISCCSELLLPSLPPPPPPPMPLHANLLPDVPQNVDFVTSPTLLAPPAGTGVVRAAHAAPRQTAGGWPTPGQAAPPTFPDRTMPGAQSMDSISRLLYFDPDCDMFLADSPPQQPEAHPSL